MDRQKPHHPFPDRKGLEKLLKKNETSIFNMKNRTAKIFAIPLETLTQHAMVAGRPGSGKNKLLTQFKKFNKEADHGTKKHSKRR